jgi:hypothetical protein
MDEPDEPTTATTGSAELGRELLRIETQADLRAARELRRDRDRQRLRRPPGRFDLLWIAVPVTVGLAGMVVTGPHPLWYVALGIGAIYGLGELRERLIDRRTAAATADDPARVLTLHEHGITLSQGGGTTRLPWRALDEVRRLPDAYIVRFHDDVEPLYVPFEALGSSRRSGRLESLLASRDRLVQDV